VYHFWLFSIKINHLIMPFHGHHLAENLLRFDLFIDGGHRDLAADFIVDLFVSTSMRQPSRLIATTLIRNV